MRLLGLASGYALAELLKRLGRGTDGGGGIRALLLVSGGLSVFAATTWLGGSGFLAVYAMGVLVGNRARRVVRSSLSAMDGYAWLSQAGMFLLLGLLVTPSQLLPTLAPALGVSLVLMFVARPLAVWLCLAPLRFPAGEIVFISWVGLARGGAHRAGGVPAHGRRWRGRRGLLQCGLRGGAHFAAAAGHNDRLDRAALGPGAARARRCCRPTGWCSGTSSSTAATPMETLCAFYGLPTPAEPAAATCPTWLREELRRPAGGRRQRACSARPN